MTEDILVTRFREYIRVNTMQPNPDYVGADVFIKNYGDEMGLEYSKCEPVAGKPCIVLTWKGQSFENSIVKITIVKLTIVKSFDQKNVAQK